MRAALTILMVIGGFALLVDDNVYNADVGHARKFVCEGSQDGEAVVAANADQLSRAVDHCRSMDLLAYPQAKCGLHSLPEGDNLAKALLPAELVDDDPGQGEYLVGELSRPGSPLPSTYIRCNVVTP